MKFCQNHWDALKKAIAGRGLFDFVSKDGKEALDREASHAKNEPITKLNFDPLMGAHWMIASQAAWVLRESGTNPFAMLVGDPDHPELECPICLLNFMSAEHDKDCTDPNCPKGKTFDEWIDIAADSTKTYVENLPDK